MASADAGGWDRCPYHQDGAHTASSVAPGWPWRTICWTETRRFWAGGKKHDRTISICPPQAVTVVVLMWSIHESSVQRLHERTGMRNNFPGRVVGYPTGDVNVPPKWGPPTGSRRRASARGLGFARVLMLAVRQAWTMVSDDHADACRQRAASSGQREMGL